MKKKKKLDLKSFREGLLAASEMLLDWVTIDDLDFGYTQYEEPDINGYRHPINYNFIRKPKGKENTDWVDNYKAIKCEFETLKKKTIEKKEDDYWVIELYKTGY